MANPEHVKVVRAGEAAIKQWRKEHEDQQLDLRKASLSGAALWRANLANADLRGANLEGAILRLANLMQADLRGANLRGAELQGAEMWRADLRGANLRGAILEGTNLQGVLMSLVQRIQGWRGVWRK